MGAVVRLMTCAVTLAWLVLVASAGSADVQAIDAQQSTTSGPRAAVSPQRALLNQYCVACHNQRQKAGGATPIALDSLDVSNVGADAEQLGESGAEAARRSDAAGRHAAPGPGHARRLRRLGRRRARPRSGGAPEPGRTETFHRLNRAEYQNVVRDLLASRRGRGSRCCRPTTSAAGSTTSPASLKMSPTLMERYLAAAQKIEPARGRHAGAAPERRLLPRCRTICRRTTTCRACRSARAAARAFATRSRCDGEYVIRVRLARDMNDGMPVVRRAAAARSEPRRRARCRCSRCRACLRRRPRQRVRRRRRSRAAGP